MRRRAKTHYVGDPQVDSWVRTGLAGSPRVVPASHAGARTLARLMSRDAGDDRPMLSFAVPARRAVDETARAIRALPPHGTRRTSPAAVIKLRVAGLASAVGAAAVAAVLIASGLVAPGAAVVTVSFELAAPQARGVSVVGDFNDWRPLAGVMGDDDGDGVWQLSIDLRRGHVYTYNFLVDGVTWISDPSQLARIRDAFGGEKSLLRL